VFWNPTLQAEQIARSLCRQRHHLVGVLRVARGHQVAVAVVIVVVAGPRPAVADAESLIGNGSRQRGSVALTVAAEEGGEDAFSVKAIGGRGENCRRRVHDNRAGDAVAAKADGSDASHHLQLRDRGRIDVGERRVHVVRTGRRNEHAVGHHSYPLVVQSMQDWDRGQGAVVPQAGSRDVDQEFGGIEAASLIANVHRAVSSSKRRRAR
jgi:hypothetical protein